MLETLLGLVPLPKGFSTGFMSLFFPSIHSVLRLQDKEAFVVKSYRCKLV